MSVISAIRILTGEEETKHEMRAVDRARIHLHYVPAARDPVKQIRQASGSIMARLFKAVKWSKEVQESVLKSSAEIQVAFGEEDGVGSIQSALSKNWKMLHDAGIYSGVKIRPVSNRFEDLLRQVEAVFAPSPGGEDDPLERLSDGQRSLFYIAMVGAAFDIESQVLDGDEEGKSFDGDRLSPPSLTIFAVEEPENHVAPHYLGGIMKVLRRLPESGRAQVVLTSHSPSILHRVEPEEVRHLRLDTKAQSTLVREILLPKDTDDSHKFIREAVRAYPELYFARLVALGEGDSEEIVLPKVAESFRMPIDQSFVSIVPLGGRHVNHMWRLLNALEIPHLTILDFDQERKGGGWGRVKYALKQLLAVGVPKAKLLAVDDGKGGTTTLDDSDLRRMHTWELSEETVAELAGLNTERMYRDDFVGLVPRDICILTRMRPDDYTATLREALRSRDIEARVESELQDILSEPLTTRVSDVLKLATRAQAPESRTAMLDLLTDFEGGDPEAVGRKVEIRLATLVKGIKEKLGANGRDAENVRAVLDAVVDGLGREAIGVVFPQYSQGNLMELTLGGLSKALVGYLADREWSAALDALEGLGAVPIMTMHKSKGLEYHTVVFVGLEDSAHWNFANSQEEEARGFFVAFSRAEKRVLFTFCQERPKYAGKPAVTQQRDQIGMLYDLLRDAGIKPEEVA